MHEIHGMMRDVPVLIYALMVGIPLTFAPPPSVSAGTLQAAAHRRPDGSAAPRGQQQALAAGIADGDRAAGVRAPDALGPFRLVRRGPRPGEP